MQIAGLWAKGSGFTQKPSHPSTIISFFCHISTSPLSLETESPTKGYLIQSCLFTTTTLLIQIPAVYSMLYPCSFSISSLSGLYHPAGVCVNLFETAVHQLWVVMATPGQKFCAVTSILQTISCVSPPSRTALFTQEGVEVRNWLHRHMCMCWLDPANDSISCLIISVPQASCRDCELEEASSSKDTLEAFCRSDFGEYQ